jgi:hypothetical protein
MNDDQDLAEYVEERCDGLENQLNELSEEIEELEDNDLRKQLIELCLKGSGSDLITKEMLLQAINL